MWNVIYIVNTSGVIMRNEDGSGYYDEGNEELTNLIEKYKRIPTWLEEKTTDIDIEIEIEKDVPAVITLALL